MHNWIDATLIKSENHGFESWVQIYDNYVVKLYKRRYFRYNKIYSKKGEAFYLKNYPSDFFPKLLDEQEKFIVISKCGSPISISRRNLELKTTGLDYLQLVIWLRELRKELSRLKLIHRDINPSNILYDSNTNKYTLIDFGWMISQSDPNGNKDKHRLLNPYAKDDNEAIDKISTSAIKILLSRIGSDKYKDGSSLKSGWVYHPVAFSEFQMPTHKDAALEEYKEVLKYMPFLQEGKQKVLDIGCNIGYFSFNLAQIGNDVVGIEADSNVYEAAEAIRTYKKIDNVKFINGSIVEAIDSLFGFDVIIFLNAHMWIYKQVGAEKTIELMKKLASKTKHMLFQTAGLQSGGMFQVKELKDDLSIKLYLENCGFTDVTKLRDTRAHRGIRSLFLAKGVL